MNLLGGLPSEDTILASAARFLIDGKEENAASVLLSCSLEASAYDSEWWNGDRTVIGLVVTLYGPRTAYDALAVDDPAGNYPIREAVWRAINATLPIEYGLEKLIARAELVDIDPNWRSELLEIARGRGVHNQAATGAIPLTWHNLRFRSRTEMRVAEALERRKILFLPNCLARLNVGLGRENREADFLVCVNGKWGILEVDGEPFHPPSRTAYDHERDRLFRAHGIRVVEHFDAARCFQSPDEVVGKFLEILEKA